MKLRRFFLEADSENRTGGSADQTASAETLRALLETERGKVSALGAEKAQLASELLEAKRSLAALQTANADAETASAKYREECKRREVAVRNGDPLHAPLPAKQPGAFDFSQDHDTRIGTPRQRLAAGFKVVDA